LAAGIALTTGTMWIIGRLSAPPTPQPVRFTSPPPQDRPLVAAGPDRDIAITPDGRTIVYRVGSAGAVGPGTGTGLAVRPLGELETRILVGVTGARNPFISPDGRWVGYFSGGELKKISVSGGPAITLCKYPGAPRGASWGPEDVIVSATPAPAPGLSAVPAGGGEPKALTTPGSEGDQLFPSVLPGGEAILFTIQAAQPENSQVAVLDRPAGKQNTLVRGGSAAEFVEPGYLIYAVSGTLRAIRFDPERLTVSGDAVTVLEQVSTSGTGAGEFAISPAV